VLHAAYHTLRFLRGKKSRWQSKISYNIRDLLTCWRLYCRFRPGKRTLVVEIKSTDEVDEGDATVLKHFVQDFDDAEFQIWSTDPRKKKFGDITAKI
jgi:hypothetical protein